MSSCFVAMVSRNQLYFGRNQVFALLIFCLEEAVLSSIHGML